MSNQIQVTIVVNGYKEGNYHPDHGTFVASFRVAPSVGDLIEIKPGGNWGTIWCVVEARAMGSDWIKIMGRLPTDVDEKRFAEHGEDGPIRDRWMPETSTKIDGKR